MDSTIARKHTTRRRAIIEALCRKLEQINGNALSELQSQK